MFKNVPSFLIVLVLVEVCHCKLMNAEENWQFSHWNILSENDDLVATGFITVAFDDEIVFRKM